MHLSDRLRLCNCNLPGGKLEICISVMLWGLVCGAARLNMVVVDLHVFS